MTNVPIVQIAYVVSDIRAAALKHSKLFGSGPFFVADHVPIPSYVHRGREQPFDHSTALGQWGQLMIEFTRQHNAAPSHIHDMFPHGSGNTGLHHAAMFVDNLDESIRDFGRQGFDIAAIGGGTDFRAAIIDATEVFGHQLEIHERDPGLVKTYALVKSASENWDGSEPIRDIQL